MWKHSRKSYFDYILLVQSMHEIINSSVKEMVSYSCKVKGGSEARELLLRDAELVDSSLLRSWRCHVCVAAVYVVTVHRMYFFVLSLSK